MSRLRSLLFRQTPEAEAIKLIGTQVWFWVAYAVGSYQTILLQDNGFSASVIGVINALMSAVAIVGNAAWGVVSDRTGSVRRVNMILMAVGYGGFALIPFLAGLPGAVGILMVFIPLLNFFRGPTTVFLDNLTVRNSNGLGLNYGVIRASGSIAFAVVSLLVAMYIGGIGVENTFWLAAVLILPPVVLVLFCAEPAAAGVKKKKMPLALLFKEHRYVVFLVFTAVFYTAFNFEFSFLPYFLEEAGIGNTTYGVLLAVRGGMEVPLLLWLGRLLRRFNKQHLLMVAAVLIAAESLLYGTVVDSLAAAVLVSLVYGLGNGLYIGVAPNYIYDLAPDELKATAQALYASVTAAAGIAGNLLGGVLFDAVGAQPFYRITAGIFLVSILLFGGGLLLWGRKKQAQN